MSSEEI
jgi:DNA-directed RNA polymerase II subunit RPB1